jgi:hypothetical protein
MVVVETRGLIILDLLRQDQRVSHQDTR